MRIPIKLKLLLGAGVVTCFLGCAMFKPLETPKPIPSPSKDRPHEQDRSVKSSQKEEQVKQKKPHAGKTAEGLKHQSEQAKGASFLSEQEEEAEATEEPEASFDVPVETNDHVLSFIQYFKGPKKNWMKYSLKRAGRYLPQMQLIFRQEGLPEDLVYLALIESGFNPHAYSRAGAAGIWQFIPSTGIRYGLRINWWIDERRDPEKSTRAAARYLKDLYAQFGDWYLAAAAYNCGEGNIERVMRRHSVDNFWHLSRLQCLPMETQEFVPKYLAAMMIAKEPEKHGFELVEPDDPLLYDTVKVPYRANLRDIAEACDTEHRVLLSLNPELRRGCTPPSYEGYRLKVPLGKENTLLKNFSTIDPIKQTVTYHRHKVRKGENLASIARRYGISTGSIMKTNNLKNNYTIRERQSLIIPIISSGIEKKENKPTFISTKPKGSAVSPKDSGYHDYSKVLYEIKEGDSLWKIGKRYGVESSSIKQWNKGVNSKKLTPGQKLVLWIHKDNHIVEVAGSEGDSLAGGRQKIIYIIKPGDNLWDIARRYKVTVADIINWNKIDTHRPLRVGDRLQLYPTVQINAYRSQFPPQAMDD